MIAFENAWAFLLLLAIPILFTLRQFKVFQKSALPLTFSDWHGKSFSFKPFLQNCIRKFSSFLFLIAYICLVIAFTSPIKRTRQKVYSSRGADILFVVDTSPSMASRDIAGLTRLEAAKQAIRLLEKEHQGTSIGLVEMAKEAALVVPPTADHEIFLKKLDEMIVGELGDGTAIGTGLSCAIFHLESSHALKKSIVLITDGENNAGEIHPNTIARLAKEKGISLSVLGIGTKGSVPLEYSDPKTGKLYSGFLNSDYDVSSLAKIANEAQGAFFEVESMDALSQALEDVSKSENLAQSYYIKNSEIFYYIYFLYAAGFLFVLGFFIRRFILKEFL